MDMTDFAIKKDRAELAKKISEEIHKWDDETHDPEIGFYLSGLEKALEIING